MQRTFLPLRQVIIPTTPVRSVRLNDRLGAEVTLVSETFQHTGSFKFRAAYNLASNTREELILTASSGNFGQALAYACKLLGKRCIVVMPTTSAHVKIEAVREHGGAVELVDVRVKSRAERLAELAEEHGQALIASAYDNEYVIAGNQTLGEEIYAIDPDFDFVLAPVGGGGLSAGIIQGLRGKGSRTVVVGAEPLMANDAARSLRQGKIVANDHEPQTLADGARTLSIGLLNFEILQREMHSIVEVPEEKIAEAWRLIFNLANLKSEPTGALTVAALLTNPEAFSGKRVCCVVSGGNVDPAIVSRLLSGDPL